MSKIKTPLGVQITKTQDCFSINKNKTSVDIKEELKTISKFTTNINNISCSSEQEEALKNHIENEVLTNIENKINEKIQAFSEKLVENVKNKRNPKYSEPIYREPKEGTTEIGESGEEFSTEQGWNLGHTTKNRMVRVDDERMSQLKRINDPVDIRHAPCALSEKDLLKRNFIHEKAMHQNGPKLEENNSLVEFYNNVKDNKTRNETGKKKSPKKKSKSTKKKSASKKKSVKKSGKKKSKSTKKKVSKNGRKTKNKRT